MTCCNSQAAKISLNHFNVTSTLAGAGKVSYCDSSWYAGTQSHAWALDLFTAQLSSVVFWCLLRCDFIEDEWYLLWRLKKSITESLLIHILKLSLGSACKQSLRSIAKKTLKPNPKPKPSTEKGSRSLSSMIVLDPVADKLYVCTIACIAWKWWVIDSECNRNS